MQSKVFTSSHLMNQDVQYQHENFKTENEELH
jgi:hypothetical protein